MEDLRAGDVSEPGSLYRESRLQAASPPARHRAFSLSPFAPLRVSPAEPAARVTTLERFLASLGMTAVSDFGKALPARQHGLVGAGGPAGPRNVGQAVLAPQDRPPPRAGTAPRPYTTGLPRNMTRTRLFVWRTGEIDLLQARKIEALQRISARYNIHLTTCLMPRNTV